MYCSSIAYTTAAAVIFGTKLEHSTAIEDKSYTLININSADLAVL